MTDARLLAAQRAAHEDGTPEAWARVLRLRVAAGEQGPVACEPCKGTGKGKRRAAGTAERTETRGLVCCCGSEESDYEHGAGGVDHYTHGFVHACDYHGVECECSTTTETVTVTVWTTDCSACDGTGLAPFRRSVELAAYCGDPAARLVVFGELVAERTLAWGAPVPSALDDWLRGLGAWGPAVLARAAVAAAREVFPWWSGALDQTQLRTLERARDALRAAEAWLACPCEEHLALVPVEFLPEPWETMRLVIFAAPREGARGGAREQWAREAIEGFARLLGPDRVGLWHGCAVREPGDGEARVRAAVSRALISWTMGGEA